METTLLRQAVDSRSFALADLFLVLTSAAIWILSPEIGAWIIPIAILPWGLRLAVDKFPFRRTPFDWLIALLLITAWVGYWAAYDQETAWSKVWLIVLAVLLFYALAGQPRENLEWVCMFLFSVGLGVAVYFLMTHDFVALPRKIEFINRLGLWIMQARPQWGWTPIDPNYVAGIVSITTPFVIYPASTLIKKDHPYSRLLGSLILAGMGLALLAILMTTSRGIIMASASAFGIWLGWRGVELNGSSLRLRQEAFFPFLVLLFLCAVVVLLYAGPATLTSNLYSQYYGTGSRSELLKRSFYLVFDFPLTGGGLNSFPGLYSHYMLGIPFFNVVNSHNLFLDIAIEQGWLGGLSFLAIFLTSIWLTAKAIATDAVQGGIFNWLTLFALIIAFVHGLVDDYLYNGAGTLFIFVPVGLSMVLQSETVHRLRPAQYRVRVIAALILLGLLVMNLNEVRAAWYANLGAVQMAKVVLADFPTNQWTSLSVLPDLQRAESTLQAALQSNPANYTANYRLGLISMLRQDFVSAAAYLEKAHQVVPDHRGIVKSLGYCYAWLGDIEKASLLLGKIPEADNELKIYSWWWETQGRNDLSTNASLVLDTFGASAGKP